MKLAKSWFVIISAFLCLTAGTVLAADKAQELKQESKKLEAVVNESQMWETADRVEVELFKKAGLSYQPSLVVPVEGVVGCKDNEQLRILTGMYTFDANYALLFGKKQEFAAANGLRNDVPDRLNLRDKLKFKTFTPDELKKVLDNPDDPANRDLYVKYAAANFHDMLEASKSDPEMLALFLDAGYGAIVEGLYVSSKLALAAGTGEKLVALFNEQAVRLDKLHQALVAYAGDPELDALAKRAQRERVLRPVSEILKSKKGNLAEADVTKILSLIEPERSKVVGKCK
jgi:hypothetical protein